MLLIDDIEGYIDMGEHTCLEWVIDHYCEKKIATDQGYLDHLRTVHGKGAPTCGISGPRSKGLKCYRDRGHSGDHRYTRSLPEDRVFVCKEERYPGIICDKRFASMGSITNHQQDMHRIPIPRCGYVSEDGTKSCLRLPDHKYPHMYTNAETRRLKKLESLA